MNNTTLLHRESFTYVKTFLVAKEHFLLSAGLNDGRERTVTHLCRPTYRQLVVMISYSLVQADIQAAGSNDTHLYRPTYRQLVVMISFMWIEVWSNFVHIYHNLL